ncbi:hypothetical protein [Pseudomonas chlororaphis]|uniref:hypothetical protein n=1 Tax=Pseudomonas chlororaphis TaxID=587753 RepID=UPI00056469B0|nr:hypothetical protein [Pseudomonas chlororaphis]
MSGKSTAGVGDPTPACSGRSIIESLQSGFMTKGFVEMMRYFVIFISLVMLSLSFIEPKAPWRISFNFMGLLLPQVAYTFFFVVCIFLYFPMIVVGLYYFVKSAVRWVRFRDLRGGFEPFILFALIVVSLSRFGDWVVYEIF